MSSFTPNVKKDFTLEDDTITVEFKRLTRAQMLTLTPYSPGVSGVDENGEPIIEEMTTEQNYKLLDVGVNCLTDCVVSFVGLKDSEGVAMLFDEIKNEAYFTGLLGDMLTELMNSSMVSEKK